VAGLADGWRGISLLPGGRISPRGIDPSWTPPVVPVGENVSGLEKELKFPSGSADKVGMMRSLTLMAGTCLMLCLLSLGCKDYEHELEVACIMSGGNWNSITQTCFHATERPSIRDMLR